MLANGPSVVHTLSIQASLTRQQAEIKVAHLEQVVEYLDPRSFLLRLADCIITRTRHKPNKDLLTWERFAEIALRIRSAAVLGSLAHIIICEVTIAAHIQKNKTRGLLETSPVQTRLCELWSLLRRWDNRFSSQDTSLYSSARS